MKTKIYLTIGGLLALTGVFYASNPTVFVLPGNGVNRPISPAVTQALFTVTQYEDGTVDVVGCNRQGTMFGILPIGQQLVEKYMVIAPAESAAAGFTPGDLFVTVQQSVVKTTPPSGVFMPFASWSGVAGGCPNSDHSSLTFDKVGTFGFKMIITCEGGRIFTIDNLPGGPHVAHLTDTTTPAHGQTFIEGPDVLPLSFGALGRPDHGG